MNQHGKRLLHRPDIAAAHRVKHVIAKGRSYTMDELLHPKDISADAMR